MRVRAVSWQPRALERPSLWQMNRKLHLEQKGCKSRDAAVGGHCSGGRRRRTGGARLDAGALMNEMLIAKEVLKFAISR